MPSVLYIIDSLQMGGAERSILDIASRLKNMRPIVCYIYRNDFLKAEFERCGIKVIALDVDGNYNFLKAYKRFKAVLVREKPDMVVATLLRSELISRIACRVVGIPNIGTFVNDTYSLYELAALRPLMKLKVGFMWLVNMLTAKLCTGFLSNSESVKESNCRKLFVDRHKVTTIYRGRSKEAFVFQTRFPERNKIRFLAVARLLYRKGLQDLLEAFRVYHLRYPEATLDIAGDGPEKTTLQKLVRDYGLDNHVRLLGTVRDTPQLMREHDVLVFPSHYEGFSGTIVEAMFSGLPIIASDIAMNKEAVEHLKTAIMFKVQDVHDLSNAMAWVTENFTQAQQAAGAARLVAEQRFDISSIAYQHDNYYRSVLKGFNK